MRCALTPILMAFLILAIPCPTSMAQLPDANSTKTERVKPNSLAAKAGTGVQWAPSFDAAVSRAKETGKPIFWYVPTVRGTFMDRRDVVDFYMMAGYFSWPANIELLNTRFIPVKAAPTREQQGQFDLIPYRFIEPGFVILDPQLKPLLTLDRLTTQHPQWFQTIVQKTVQEFPVAQNGWSSVAKDQPLPQLVIGENDREWLAVPPVTVNPDPTDNDPLQAMTYAMETFRSGRHQQARQLWKELAQQWPDHPLGWKAAAEAQGIGPFVRGFEVFNQLPGTVLEQVKQWNGSAAPVGLYTEHDLWRHSIDFILAMQDERGAFTDSDYDFGGADSLPNVHTAVTSLAGMALIQSHRSIPDFQTAAIDRAIAKCSQYVVDRKSINRNDRDEILWAQAYRLRFLCAYRKSGKSELEQEIQDAATAVENLQSRRGNWYHEYENPFVTATALCALHDAQQAGAKIDMEKIESGIQALADTRSSNGAWPYYANKNRDHDNSIPAAAGRMPLCELALHRWGKSDQERLVSAVNSSLEFHDKLAAGYKYDNHTSTYAYGGFFFWYDMRSRTEAITAIEDRSIRHQLMQRQKQIVMGLPEIDGCFVDSHELGRTYGTAMALLCLAEIRDALANQD